jgi:hypothetical protein
MSSRIPLPLMVAALAAALAAACTGESAATGSPSGSPPGSANPPTAAPLATRPSMDPELEEMLPDRVGRLEIAKSSLAGLEFSGSADPTLQQFLRDIGISGSAISVASGVGASTEAPPSSVFLLAIRVRGASEDQIVSTFRRALEASEQRAYTVTAQTVSGKEVLVADAQGTDDSPAYFYALGEVMLFAAASDQALAEEAIALLP